MEIFGIILSVPVAFVASVVYCFLLARVVVRVETLRRMLWFVSIGVLVAFGVEVILLLTLGAVRARGLLGPGFYVGHVILFFLGTPALANVLVLRKRPKRLVQWYLAVPLCTVFALALVLLQYGVSEALYGIDGDDGPFSTGQVLDEPFHLVTRNNCRVQNVSTTPVGHTIASIFLPNVRGDLPGDGGFG
jgi:hypothetical protein